MIDESVDRYLEEIQAATTAVDRGQLLEVADLLMRIWSTGATVFALGNGGSASLASHVACDLGKNTSADLGLGPERLGARRLRVVGLSDNAALMTAMGNDIDFSDIYVEQLKPHLTPADTVLAISGSGVSPNVLRALHYARTVGATTIAFTSSRPTSQQMLDLADYALVAPVETMEQIEDMHVMFNHVLTTIVRDRIAQQIAEQVI